MPECPRCGITVTVPTKTWSMVGTPNKTDERLKLTLGVFNCPNCEKNFLEVLGKKKEGTTIEVMVNEIKGIERRLMHTLGDLREKIEKLKLERTEILDEIEKLKRAGEEKAETLEKEVASLREEVKSIKEMLSEIE